MNQQRFGFVILGIFFGKFVSLLNSGTVTVAIPYIMESMNIDVSTAQWVVTGFMLAMGTIAPIVAYLGEKFSFKGLYVYALTGLVISSLLCGLSWGSGSLVAFRILQGLCCGAIVPATMTIIYQTVEKSKQPMAISLWSAASMLAPAIGPTLGGLLTQYFGWKSLFFMNIPFGLLAIVLAVIFIPKQEGKKSKSLDTLGLITSTIASTFLMIYASQGNKIGWLSGFGLAYLFTGLFSLLIFVWRELTTKTPMLNLKVLKHPTFTYGTVVNCLLNIGLYGGSFLVPIFMIQVQGVSSLTVGLVMLPGVVVMIITNLVCGKLYHKLKPIWLLLGAIGSLTIGSLVFTRLSLTTTIAFVLLGQFLRYAGLGFAPGITNLSMSTIPPAESGHASSILNWSRAFFASLALGIFSAVYEGRIQTHLAEMNSVADNSVVVKLAAVSAMNETFMLATLIMGTAFPVIFLLKKSLLKSRDKFPLEKDMLYEKTC